MDLLDQLLQWISGGSIGADTTIGGLLTLVLSTVATKFINKPGEGDGKLVTIAKKVAGYVGAGGFKDSDKNWTLPGTSAE